MMIKLLILLAALIVGYIATVLIAAAAVDTSRLYTDFSGFYYLVARSIAKLGMLFCGVRVEVSGAEKLPRDPFLLVCNHRSAFDPFVTLAAISGVRLAFISKPENFDIPVLGRLMRRCCHMPIDRENPRRAMETIQAAAELLKKGEQSVAVYPEGTRNTTEVLLPFHSGVMKIAQRAQVGLVVATVEGTDLIQGNMPFRRTRVRLSILQTFTPDELKALRSTELGEQVRAIMEKQLLKDAN
ncbi:MAG: 1-acyl-sn-glycerol-3-phosphate acyltransferase [Oscillospiraceae bacterium]|nr:1-acyl-sn-glycerol-3-phosphate acyltransferase [Oscillospiraceae bacterium]